MKTDKKKTSQSPQNTIEGKLFCIPLFMPKDDWKLKTKLDEKDYDKKFAFGRAIEDRGGTGVLVEIFNKTGHINVDVDEIIRSGRLFPSVLFFWDGITKKRWKVIGTTDNYDKWTDSNYADIRIVIGVDDCMQLYDFGTKKKTRISEEDAKEYEHATVWWPIDLEKRIIKSISATKKKK